MRTDHEPTITDAGEQKGLAVFWSYLSQVFISTPGKDSIEGTRELLPLIEELAHIDEKAGKAAKKLRSFLNICDNLSDEEVEERLNLAYTSLFCLTTPVFMTESSWLSPDGLVMQEEWEKVMLTYKKYNFNKPQDCSELEDHIGLEFLFMASLSFKIAELLNDRPDGYETSVNTLLTEKKAFLTNHLGKWIAMFAESVYKKDNNLGLYSGAALLGLVIVGFEKS